MPKAPGAQRSLQGLGLSAIAQSKLLEFKSQHVLGSAEVRASSQAMVNGVLAPYRELQSVGLVTISNVSTHGAKERIYSIKTTDKAKKIGF